MGEAEKYNFYVHSDIKEKVVIINITPPMQELFIFQWQFAFSSVRGSSNKVWQWSHISKTVIEIRIL